MTAPFRMTGEGRNLMLTVQYSEKTCENGTIGFMNCFRIPGSLEKASNSDFELAEMMAHEPLLSFVLLGSISNQIQRSESVVAPMSLPSRSIESQPNPEYIQNLTIAEEDLTTPEYEMATKSPDLKGKGISKNNIRQQTQ
jgi:hypothetical protein